MTEYNDMPFLLQPGNYDILPFIIQPPEIKYGKVPVLFDLLISLLGLLFIILFICCIPFFILCILKSDSIGGCDCSELIDGGLKWALKKRTVENGKST